VGTRIGVSGRDSTRLGGWIDSSRRDSSELRGGIVVSGRDSGRLGGWIVVSGRDSSRLGGGMVVFERDSGGLGGIVAPRRDSGRLGGGTVAPRCDSTGLIEGFRRVSGTRLLDCILGSNSCNAFLFLDLTVLARHVSQVARTLLPRLEASLRNEENRRFWRHEQQYLESILDVKA
jgi:hypothetical protein